MQTATMPSNRDLNAELPGNHVLARMSHEATTRSLEAGTDAAGASARQRAAAVAHDSEDSVWASTPPQDCVDEAAMESFPASDPPAHTPTHA